MHSRSDCESLKNLQLQRSSIQGPANTICFWLLELANFFCMYVLGAESPQVKKLLCLQRVT
jgi:hypothetical protein